MLKKKMMSDRQGRVGGKNVTTGIARNLVEHVNKVEKEGGGTCGGGVMGEVAINERLCGVDDKVCATRHGDAKLTIGK
jgi:hypothetical protein